MGMLGNQLAAGQALTVANDSFNGDGSTTAFTLSHTVGSVNDIEVLVDNVQQSPYDSSYSVSGTTLTFSGAPSAGTNNVYVIYNASKHITTSQIIPDDGSVTDAKIAAMAASKLTGNIPYANMPGSMIQTVQRISTSHETINTSSWTATNVFASITPNSTSSKILVRMTGTIRTYNTSGQAARGAWRLYKDIGGGGFNRVGTHQFSHSSYDYGSSGSLNDIPYHVEYLDSPSTTSEVTYKLYGSHEAGSASEVGPDGDDEQYTILTEIAQ